MVEELLCEEGAEIGFKLGKSARSDECAEVVTEVVAVVEGQVVVSCGEGCAWRSDTAGDESDWGSCDETVEPLRTLCDGDLNRDDLTGEAPPWASTLEVGDAARHKLLGMDFEVLGPTPEEKLDWAGIDGGEVVCLVLVNTDTGTLVGVGCKLLKTPRLQIRGSGVNCMDLDESDSGDVRS